MGIHDMPDITAKKILKENAKAARIRATGATSAINTAAAKVLDDEIIAAKKVGDVVVLTTRSGLCPFKNQRPSANPDALADFDYQHEGKTLTVTVFPFFEEANT